MKTFDKTIDNVFLSMTFQMNRQPFPYTFVITTARCLSFSHSLATCIGQIHEPSQKKTDNRRLVSSQISWKVQRKATRTSNYFNGSFNKTFEQATNSSLMISNTQMSPIIGFLCFCNNNNKKTSI